MTVVSDVAIQLLSVMQMLDDDDPSSQDVAGIIYYPAAMSSAHGGRRGLRKIQKTDSLARFNSYGYGEEEQLEVR